MDWRNCYGGLTGGATAYFSRRSTSGDLHFQPVPKSRSDGDGVGITATMAGRLGGDGEGNLLPFLTPPNSATLEGGP